MLRTTPAFHPFYGRRPSSSEPPKKEGLGNCWQSTSGNFQNPQALEVISGTDSPCWSKLPELEGVGGCGGLGLGGLLEVGLVV